MALQLNILPNESKRLGDGPEGTTVARNVKNVLDFALSVII